MLEWKLYIILGRSQLLQWTAKETEAGFAGGTLNSETDAVRHRKLSCPEPGSDTLDRIDDCVAMAALKTQEAASVFGQSTSRTI